MLREAELELKKAAAQQEASDAASAALARRAQEQETSFRQELAKAQRQFREELDAAHAEAARVVAATEQRIAEIEGEAAGKVASLEGEMLARVEEARQLADERVARMEAEADAARDAASITSRPGTGEQEERAVKAEAGLKRARDDLGKERKRTAMLIKENGGRKQELAEAQATIGRLQAAQATAEAEAEAAATEAERRVQAVRTVLEQEQATVARLRAAEQPGQSSQQLMQQQEEAATMRAELASLRAAVGALEQERTSWLAERDATATETAKLRAALNAAPQDKTLEQLTQEYEALKAAGRLAEAFPLGQRIRQLKRGGSEEPEGAAAESAASANEELVAVRAQLRQSEQARGSMAKLQRVLESQLVDAQLGYQVLKSEMENTRVLLAEMEAEALRAPAPDPLAAKNTGSLTVEQLLAGAPRVEPEPEPEPEPEVSGFMSMSSLFTTVKTTLGMGGRSTAEETPPSARPGTAPAAAASAKERVEEDPLMQVKAMMINKSDGTGPSAEDVHDYAVNVLEMEVEKYPHLIWIAEEALLQTELPKGWVQRVDASGRTFYKNKASKNKDRGMTYDNPIDTAHRQIYKLQVRKERAKAAKEAARNRGMSTAAERAMEKLVATHEGQVAVLLNFYHIVDGGRTEEAVDQILKKRWLPGASALSQPQWQGLAEKMRQKYDQCPIELWHSAVESGHVDMQ